MNDSVPVTLVGSTETVLRLGVRPPPGGGAHRGVGTEPFGLLILEELPVQHDVQTNSRGRALSKSVGGSDHFKRVEMRKAGPFLVRPLLPTIGGSFVFQTRPFPDPEASG